MAKKTAKKVSKKAGKPQVKRYKFVAYNPEVVLRRREDYNCLTDSDEVVDARAVRFFRAEAEKGWRGQMTADAYYIEFAPTDCDFELGDKVNIIVEIVKGGAK